MYLQGTRSGMDELQPMSTNVFDEILALLSPERLLRDPQATGKGVSIALIDSGIDQSILNQRFQARGITIEPIEGAIFRSDSAPPLPYEGKQSSPHGTTVADIILSLAPQVKLYSADVFGTNGATEVEILIRAIQHAIDVWKVKVINLSLGVPEYRLQQLPKRHQFLRAIEDGYYRDVLIFAAAHNEHPLTRSYPAVFAPPLISVDKGLFDDPMKFAYSLREHIEFQAHGRGYLGAFSREPATSWATPHLTGISAKILSLRPNLKPFEMKTILYWLSQAAKRDMAHS